MRMRQFVRELAAAHGLEVICESRDVKAYAAEKKLSLEAGAREVRYEFFREALGESGSDCDGACAWTIRRRRC